jgi:hypothetical protein
VIWATPELEDAIHAAQNRVGQCGDPHSDDHRPRVFQVELVDPERDTDAYANDTVMALSSVVIAELPADKWHGV